MDSNKQTMLVVIGSSNFEQAIDPAIKRPGRFDKIIHVPLPDVRGRQQVISLAKIKREKILATLVGLRE
jgi:ATP-dependent metalloprotease